MKLNEFVRTYKRVEARALKSIPAYRWPDGMFRTTPPCTTRETQRSFVGTRAYRWPDGVFRTTPPCIGTGVHNGRL
jgi:hypothetical protein